MPVLHGVCEANVPVAVSANFDRNEIGVLHKGNVSNPIYVRCDGVAPEVDGTDSWTVLPGQVRWIPRAKALGSPTVVEVISAGAAKFEVELP